MNMRPQKGNNLGAFHDDWDEESDEAICQAVQKQVKKYTLINPLPQAIQSSAMIYIWEDRRR